MAKITAATIPSIRPKPASSAGLGKRGGRAAGAPAGASETGFIAVFIDRGGPRV